MKWQLGANYQSARLAGQTFWRKGLSRKVFTTPTDGETVSHPSTNLAQRFLTSVIGRCRAIGENRSEGKEGEKWTEKSKIAILDAKGDQISY